MRQIKDRSAAYTHKSIYNFPNVPTMQEYTLAEHTVVDIDEDRLGSVYPLVRTAMPEVSSEQWLAYARALSGSGGVLGLCGPDGSLFGFATYDVTPTLRHGHMLQVGHFVTFELRRAGTGRQALCDAVEALARARHCGTIELRLNPRAHLGDEAAGVWAGFGYKVESAVFFVKRLAPGGHVSDRRPVASRGRRKESSVKARSSAIGRIAI